MRAVATRAVAEAEPGQHEKRHRRAFADRRVEQHADDDGMGTLRLHYDSLTTQAICHRLGLGARSTHHAALDSRTMQQRVADIAADILLGVVEPVTTPTSDLERGDAPVVLRHTGQGVSAQVHVTMTLATLAGFADAPARTLDGTVVPASVARRFACLPGSTWYRLLTDPRGGLVELSSTGYRPATPLSRAVRALHRTCVQVGCRRPADTCEHDHEVAWPTGETTQANLSPKCGPHHRGKTAGRFVSAKGPNGTVTWTYPTGHTYTTHPPPHPVDRWPADWHEPASAEHVQEALAALRRETGRRTRLRVTELRRRMDERRLRRWYAEEPADIPP